MNYIFDRYINFITILILIYINTNASQEIVPLIKKESKGILSRIFSSNKQVTSELQLIIENKEQDYHDYFDRLPVELIEHMSTFLDPHDSSILFLLEKVKLNQAQLEEFIKSYVVFNKQNNVNLEDSLVKCASFNEAYDHLMQVIEAIKYAVDTNDQDLFEIVFSRNLCDKNYIKDQVESENLSINLHSINKSLDYGLLILNYLKEYTSKKLILMPKNIHSNVKILNCIICSAGIIIGIVLLIIGGAIFHNNVIANESSPQYSECLSLCQETNKEPVECYNPDADYYCYAGDFDCHKVCKQQIRHSIAILEKFLFFLPFIVSTISPCVIAPILVLGVGFLGLMIKLNNKNKVLAISSIEEYKKLILDNKSLVMQKLSILNSSDSVV